MKKETGHRIRSFVRRRGRMTPAQRQALEQQAHLYELSIDQGMLNFSEVFKRQSEVVVEVGFGMGHSLTLMAQAHPERDYIGVEVHRPGMGSLLLQLAEKGLTNIRVFDHDVVDVLAHCIPDDSLSGVQIYFPDPWPKTRHHKRRLIQPAFIDRLRRKLKLGGRLHLATDWEDYAEHMMLVMSEARGYKNVVGHGRYAKDPELRPMTKFEQRGLKLGHRVWDLLFEAVDEDSR